VHDGPVAVGLFGRAKGLKGALLLYPYGDTLRNATLPMDILIVHDDIRETPACLHTLNPQRNYLIAGIEGVETREDAARITGARCCIVQTQLPSPGADSYYIHQLEGMALYAREGGHLCGKVVDVHNLPSVDALDCYNARNDTHTYIPFTKEAIHRIDTHHNFIIINDTFCRDILPL
jgi:16S rRNA processing protein RimM